MIEIIKDKEVWDTLVKKCDFADFYHTYDYHHTAKAKDEEPVLIHYKENDKTIVLPLLFRNIQYSLYKDATSVYGYPGPITKNITSDFNFSVFQKEIHQLFREQNIISVFSRLNSFIPYQESCLLGLGQTETLGRVVYIDLTKTLDEQWAAYSKRLRTYINKSRTIYTIKKANEPADLEAFIALYYENMRRVNANKEYFYDKKYFLDLINNNDCETELLLAINKETAEVAGGAIFTKKNTFVQYHLAGTGERYLDLNPVKLLIDEMRIRGTRENFKYFNLGGGVGSLEDSLFYFKSGFSKDSILFKVWKYMVNPIIYEDLVQERKDIQHSDETLQYFPRYRNNEQFNFGINEKQPIYFKHLHTKE
ncbi:GNAT family N-acetyltransferase [uncultured Eudoraea sp.]|uniref:GNAT family N-acetyltransferase n=1 Tax=uncultured Eudoraea sp. TaxID=1035614 RepID=UPI002604C6E5|nr:GNAT family N-acetyltransferase [uncultured Eudoraea sp.]